MEQYTREVGSPVLIYRGNMTDRELMETARDFAHKEIEILGEGWIPQMESKDGGIEVKCVPAPWKKD